MIDDPDLVEAADADGDLVQLRVVGHRVGVHPVRALDPRLARGVRGVLLVLLVARLVVGLGVGLGVVVVPVVPAARVANGGHLLGGLLLLLLARRVGVKVPVDVDLVGDVGGVLHIAGEVLVVALHHVVHGVPGPDDLTPLGPRGLHLVHGAPPPLVALEQLGVAAGGQGVLPGHPVPGHEQDVPVGQLLDVVVLGAVLPVPVEGPQDLPVVAELEDLPAVAARVLEERVVAVSLTGQDRAAFGEVAGVPRLEGRVPVMHLLAGHVRQDHTPRVEGREQGEAWIGARVLESRSRGHLHHGCGASGLGARRGDGKGDEGEGSNHGVQPSATGASESAPSAASRPTGRPGTRAPPAGPRPAQRVALAASWRVSSDWILRVRSPP